MRTYLSLPNKVTLILRLLPLARAAPVSFCPLTGLSPGHREAKLQRGGQFWPAGRRAQELPFMLPKYPAASVELPFWVIVKCHSWS